MPPSSCPLPGRQGPPHSWLNWALGNMDKSIIMTGGLLVLAITVVFPALSNALAG